MQRALLAACLVTLAACSATFSAEPGDPAPTRHADPTWGPLAVIAGMAREGHDVVEGMLRITEWCALLEQDSSREVLLLWPADATTWIAQSQSVRFESPHVGGAPATVRDGDRIRIVGSAGSEADGTIWTVASPGETQGAWTAPPQKPCVRNAWFRVGGLTPVAKRSSGDG